MGLRLEGLSKRYVSPDGSAVPVIDVESFELGDGEQVALVGGSGTGKTTLLHLIAGILTADSGRIVYDVPGVKTNAPAAATPVGEPLPYRAGAERQPGAERYDLVIMSEADRDVF